jgi:hypothetical protein
MSGDFLIWQLHSRAGGEVGETQKGGIQKIKLLFTGMVVPYRELNIHLGLKNVPRASASGRF